jgi:hypothetical protein
MIAIVVLLIVLAVVFVPLALIWALNTLFGLAIAFTLKTWLAALLLAGALSGSARGKK